MNIRLSGVTMAGGYAPSVPNARERMRDPPTFYVTVLLLHLASSVLCLIQTTSSLTRNVLLGSLICILLDNLPGPRDDWDTIMSACLVLDNVLNVYRHECGVCGSVGIRGGHSSGVSSRCGKQTKAELGHDYPVPYGA